MTKNIFTEGLLVFDVVNPDLKLNIRRYLQHIYSCIVQENPSQKELAYVGLELQPVPVR
jgi:hypothetical protein